MKIRSTMNTMKKLYIEVAGKTTLLLYAQDGRHSAPCLRILGQSIILTFFDRGGSLSTSTIDINKQPEEFLRILVGLSCARRDYLRFDETILWEKDGRKRVLVAWYRDPVEGGEVVLDKIIFISDALHGCGTTVWAGLLYPPSSQPQQEPRWIVVKDSWIDPLRKFTEGSILARLNEAGIRGVPKLLHEQQVTRPHPTHPNIQVNQSTHFLRSLLSDVNITNYHARVLSRLLTELLGKQLMDFSSLTELLVAFIDYVLSMYNKIYLLSAN